MGLDVLCREAIVPFVPLALAWLCWYERVPWRSAVRNKVGVTLLTTTLVVAPWLIRNAFVYGSPVLSGGEGFGVGYRLWVGYNDFTLVHYPWDTIDKSTALAYEALSPSERAELDRLDDGGRERWFMRRALGFIASHPTLVLEYAVVKVVAAFGPVLSPATGGSWRAAIYTASYLPILVLAFAGAVLARDRWRSLCVVYLMVASFLIVAISAHAHTSHRSYLDVYLVILASYALLTGWSTALRRPVPASAGSDC